MKIAYITNFSKEQDKGGWDGINHRLVTAMIKLHEIGYYYIPLPKQSLFQRVKNKLMRIIGIDPPFSFFGYKPLNLVAKTIRQQVNEDNYDWLFFFGQTPWIQYCPIKPYVVFMDASFPTYIEVFHAGKTYNEDSLKRIYQLEELWLSRAKKICVGSYWVWNEMQKHYKTIEQLRIQRTMIGGNIEPDEEFQYKDGKNLLFISLDFEGKGGHIVVELVKHLRDKLPNLDIGLDIIGQMPPKEILALPYIHYHGRLDKKKPADLNKFKVLLSSAFVLVHPSQKDTMGAVLIEAAYFGTPSFASNRFGIPEIVQEHGIGKLMMQDCKSDIFSLYIKDRIEYITFREKVRANSLLLNYDIMALKIAEG